MKEFIEKQIERLEELSIPIYDSDGEIENKVVFTDIAKNIVNELAEEYKDNDYWKIIYNKVCELEKKYANDGNTESVNDCIKLENLLQYFKEELQGKEEYINTSTDTSSDTSTTNADRIRSMNDEELAEFLYDTNHYFENNEYLVRFGSEIVQDEEISILDWLQSEVEGVTENE